MQRRPEFISTLVRRNEAKERQRVERDPARPALIELEKRQKERLSLLESGVLMPYLIAFANHVPDAVVNDAAYPGGNACYQCEFGPAGGRIDLRIFALFTHNRSIYLKLRTMQEITGDSDLICDLDQTTDQQVEDWLSASLLRVHEEFLKRND